MKIPRIYRARRGRIQRGEYHSKGPWGSLNGDTPSPDMEEPSFCRGNREKRFL